MSYINVFVIALGLAMDALAVSITVGLKSCDCNNRTSVALKSGIWFGGFQTGMNLMGWFLSSFFTRYIEAYGHWISFALLSLIGLNMIRDAIKKEEKACEFHNWQKVFVLALAVSIDSMAVGISFASLGDPILIPSLIIGMVSFLLSMLGVLFGNLATRIKGLCEKADFLGGSLLISMGIKILVEHI
jgi:putative Mn2+ efflux pump MntP